MKRTGNIFEKIANINNIKKAMAMASQGKKHRSVVKEIMSDADNIASQIRKELIDETFIPTKPKEMIIFEPLSKKTRTIIKPSFYPDQIVHWAIILQIKPLIMRGMYEFNCGNIPNRGGGAAKDHIENSLKKDRPGTKWCLKYDIHHYYESIDIGKLMGKLLKIIKDEKVLRLIERILKSQEKGIPIGSYLSQWMANFYLQEHDHFIKEQLKLKYMTRYVDDVVILDSNRRRLFKAKARISEYLDKERLKLKPNWSVFQTSKRAIDFVGYQMRSNGRTTIRKRIWRNVRRNILKISHHGITLKRAQTFMSYYGYIKNSSSHKIRQLYFPNLKIGNMKSAISQGGSTHVQNQR